MGDKQRTDGLDGNASASASEGAKCSGVKDVGVGVKERKGRSKGVRCGWI